MSDLESMSFEKIIFARLFKQDENVVMMRNMLKTELNASRAFVNEYFIFYNMLIESPKLHFDKEYLKLYLTINKGSFMHVDRIDYSCFTFGDTEPYLNFCDSCLTLLDECCKTEVTDAQYELNLKKYKMVYIKKESIRILEDGADIITEGKKVGSRRYDGYSDMRRYTVEEFSKLDKLTEKSKRNGTIVYGITPQEEAQQKTLKCLGGYGIPALDEHIKIYEGEMHNICAPAKGGKSRFCTSVLETCLVEYGQNCLIWSLENGQKGWEYLFRARHFNRVHNKGVTDPRNKVVLDDDMLRKGEMTPEIKAMEQASWLAFQSNDSYGKLANMDEDLCLDNFIEKIDEQVSLYDIKIICVDYLQLISRGVSGAGMQDNAVIADAYKRMLQYLKSKNIAGIFPCQFKQTAVSSLSKITPEELVNAELRDSAGGTYEVIKTPDVNLALYATTAGLRSGDLTILSIPSRTSAVFAPIPLIADFGSSTFISRESS